MNVRIEISDGHIGQHLVLSRVPLVGEIIDTGKDMFLVEKVFHNVWPNRDAAKLVVKKLETW